MKLRKYQNEAIENIVGSYRHGISSQLIVLPTGSGKTVLMGAVLKKLKSKKACIISHRKEIIAQIKETILLMGISNVGLCVATKKELDKDIILGTIQTCHREQTLKKLKKKKIELLIIDEAHHSCAKTYKRVIKEIKASLLLGFTATPNRFDKNMLSEIYQNITYSKQISELIDAGYLSNVHGIKIRMKLHLKKIKIIRGDFVQYSLSKAMNNESIRKAIIDKYKEYAKSQKALVFCVDVKHAMDLSAEFNKHGISSRFIHGNMGNKERTRIIDSFKKKDTEILTSVGVLTEGFDMPNITCIVMARPTRSKSLYMQMVGRGLRVAENKNKCLVLDFTDEDHTLHQQISLNTVIPSAKCESELQNGDCTIAPWMKESYNAKIIGMRDEEIDLLKINLKKKEVDYSKYSKYAKAAIKGRLLSLRRGNFSGNIPWGYKINKINNKKFVTVDKKNGEIVRYLYEKYITTEDSVEQLKKKIENKFGVCKNTGTWCYMLSNMFYAGIIRDKLFGDFVHSYERIISADLFNKAKDKRTMAHQGKTRKASKIDFPYRTMFKCFYCGSILSPQKSNRKRYYAYYSCYSKTKRKDKHPQRISESEINTYLLDILSRITCTIKNNEFDDNIKPFTGVKSKLFLKQSSIKKRNIIKLIFKSIQIKDRKLIYKLNPTLKESL